MVEDKELMTWVFREEHIKSYEATDILNHLLNLLNRILIIFHVH